MKTFEMLCITFLCLFCGAFGCPRHEGFTPRDIGGTRVAQSPAPRGVSAQATSAPPPAAQGQLVERVAEEVNSTPRKMAQPVVVRSASRATSCGAGIVVSLDPS